jgi:hypothetical protein
LIEIKHDGFRIIARKSGWQVRPYSRPGNDFTRRFPLIAQLGLLKRSAVGACVLHFGQTVSSANCRERGRRASVVWRRRFDAPLGHHQASIWLKGGLTCIFWTTACIFWTTIRPKR